MSPAPDDAAPADGPDIEFRALRADGAMPADPSQIAPEMVVLAYSPEEMIEKVIESPEEIHTLLERWPVVWLNVSGLGDGRIVHAIGEVFGLHNLAVEDVVHAQQRAKVEPYDDHIFIVNRMMKFEDVLDTEQLSLFLGRGFVLTIQEWPGDCWDDVRHRIRTKHGHIRGAGADYLAYALIDAVIDSYFPILDRISDKLEELDNHVLERPSTESVVGIHRIKRELIAIRRACWPFREAMNVLMREESTLILPETRLYLRDCYDHTIRIVEIVETYRELASGLMDVYLSSVSHRTNDIMKVLTIFAAIFIPLSFIAALYGMNFHDERSPWNMPELSWRFGYPFALGLMAAVAVALLGFFRYKGWLGGDDGLRRRDGRGRAAPDPPPDETGSDPAGRRQGNGE